MLLLTSSLLLGRIYRLRRTPAPRSAISEMAATKSTGTRNFLVWYWNEQYIDVLALAF
jgi:hypothetical protein